MSQPSTIPQITPLPSRQVFIVICVQICESMNINVLFPFLAFMVEDFGYTGHKIGYYAGILAASFCAAQLTSSYLWGWFSDTHGRKPALFFGTFGAGCGMLLFGLAPTFEVAVLGRCVSGLLSGNLGVLKSFLSEITDGSNRGKGFSYLNVAWSVGSILGPLLGGFLCYPVEKYPRVFNYLSFARPLFSKRPFLLPCLLCVCGNVFTSACIALLMAETRQQTGEQKSRGVYSQVNVEEDEEDGDDTEAEGERSIQLTALRTTASVSTASVSLSSSSTSSSSEAWPPRVISGSSKSVEKSIHTENSTNFYDDTVILCVLLYGLLAFGDITGNETLPLFSKLDNEQGGLSLNSSEIGFALAFGGFAGLAFSLFALPLMIGGGKSKLLVFRRYTLLNVFLIILFPLLGYVLSHLLQQADHTDTDTDTDTDTGGLSDRTNHHLVIGLFILIHICRTMASILCFTVVIIFVNHSVIDAHLGKVNGLGQMAAATARSVGPAFGGVLWSQSLKHHFIFTNFVLVSVIMLVCSCLSSRLPVSIESKKEEREERVAKEVKAEAVI